MGPQGWLHWYTYCSNPFQSSEGIKITKHWSQEEYPKEAVVGIGSPSLQNMGNTVLITVPLVLQGKPWVRNTQSSRGEGEISVPLVSCFHEGPTRVVSVWPTSFLFQLSGKKSLLKWKGLLSLVDLVEGVEEAWLSPSWVLPFQLPALRECILSLFGSPPLPPAKLLSSACKRKGKFTVEPIVTFKVHSPIQLLSGTRLLFLLLSLIP